MSLSGLHGGPGAVVTGPPPCATVSPAAVSSRGASVFLVL